MSTSTIERTTTTVAAPLTEAEENSLLALAASTEKTQKVRAIRGTRTSSRAWSLGGNVD